MSDGIDNEAGMNDELSMRYKKIIQDFREVDVFFFNFCVAVINSINNYVLLHLTNVFGNDTLNNS